MSLWRQLTRGLRVLTNRTAADAELDRELQHFIEEATSAYEETGLSPDEANRRARREAGNPFVIREEVRDGGWENVIETLLSDVRYGLRRLGKERTFTAVAVVTLALGIGASTAIFSIVNPVLFESLPYPGARQVLTISDYATDRSPIDVTFGTYRELAERNRSFAALAVMRPWQPTITGVAEPERLEGQRVSASYFRVLGIAPALGRDFDDSDDRLNAPSVVILSHGLWRRRFGEDRSVVGRQVVLNGRSSTVVGVMPATFENVLSPTAEVWSPLQYDVSLPPEGREWGHHLRMVARLRRDVRIDQAKRDVDAIARNPIAAFHRVPWASLGQGLILNSLQDDIAREFKPALLAVVGAVVLVLAIACVNVTNLLLARAAQRSDEFAMRAALGAGRSRLIRQVLTESVLLAGIAGALGVVVAHWVVRALVALSPPGLPRVGAVHIDATVLAFAVAVTSFVGLLIGLVPALHVRRHDLRDLLQRTSRQAAHGHHMTRRALVVAEVALALVMLSGAGLLVRSLHYLLAVDAGFDIASLLSMKVQVAGRQFNDATAVHRFFEQALQGAREVPDVVAAAFTSQLPLSGDFEKYGVQFEALPNDDSNEDRSAIRYGVTPGYFETMRIPLREGRFLDRGDTAVAPLVAVINDSFAKRKFPAQSAIGQRIHVGPTDRPWFTIVGVVGDVKHTSLALGQPDAVYTTDVQWFFADNPLTLVVRTRGEPTALVPALRRAIWSVDKDQPIVRISTMEALVSTSTAQRRFVLILFQVFAFVALALAAVGIFGILSGSVTERTQEIGVRAALGAARGEIVAIVVRQALGLTGIGIGIGLIGAVAASRAIESFLFGVTRLDPVTYGAVILVLLVIAAIACSIPAWRATRVDPAIALRAQ